MRIRFVLRLLFFAILAFVKIMAGMDWALIVGMVIIAADIDSIANFFEKKGKDCR